MSGNCEEAQANQSGSCQPGETGANGRVKRYSKISYETRKELIKRVLKEGQKLSEASADLGIKLSTSKFILKSFKRFGRIFRKKSTEDLNKLRPADLSESSSSPEEEPAEATPPEPAPMTCVYVPVLVFCQPPWAPDDYFGAPQLFPSHFAFLGQDSRPS